MIDFLLPSLGADMDQGQLVGWLVEPGDSVRRGQVIAEVETDKGIIEVECWHDGVIEELLVEPGPTRLPVGTPLARIRPVAEAAAPAAEPGRKAGPPVAETERNAGKPAPETGRARPLGPTAVPKTALTPRQRPETAPPGAGERVKASPRARALAERLGVNLASVPPDRTAGMIIAADVAKAAGRPAPAAGDKGAALRQAVARSMARSKREIPHYYLASHIDLHRAMTWLDGRNEAAAVAERILPAALLLKATALALRRHPELNGHWVEGGFQPVESVHLGVAVSLREGGLVAPAIHDADTLALAELMTRLRDVVSRARSLKLRSSEVADPTATVTNLGDRGVETAFPVIIPPQVAIVGFGKVVRTPVAADGSVVVHPVIHATLAADHRVTDGHRGARFLTTLDRLLQEPQSL
jgi:pyruvate dehydrogenase E2 component (dihydrolipoamide acetyltransferase)